MPAFAFLIIVRYTPAVTKFDVNYLKYLNVNNINLG